MRKNKIKGFSLIELMVVISLMSIFIVIAVPQYNNFQRGQALRTAALQLQNDIKKAQSMAYANEYETQIDFTDDKGYKIYIDSNRDGSFNKTTGADSELYKTRQITDNYMGTKFINATSATFITFSPGGGAETNLSTINCDLGEQTGIVRYCVILQGQVIDPDTSALSLFGVWLDPITGNSRVDQVQANPPTNTSPPPI
ncbi:MAG: Tfp pilus assembly protein FimT/FimU [Vulcanimicrobiota bacterium]